MKYVKYLVILIMVMTWFIPRVSGAVECSLSTNTMYKSPGSKAVYYITADCKKQLVKNPDVFFSYVSDWSEVRLTNETLLGSVPNHPLRIAPWGPRRTFAGGTLLKSPSDPRVFLVSRYSANGQAGQTTLIPFESEKSFVNNGYQWGWIEDVSQEVISKLPISGFGITADWHYYPAGVLYKHANSSAVYLSRSENGKNPTRVYIKTLDELNAQQYRFDHIPNFPETVPFADTGSNNAPNTANNAQPGPQDSAICADATNTVSGAVMICQGTTVRATSYLRIKVAVVTANDVVLSLIKNNGSTQVWTIPVGKTKTGTFFEDPNNTFSITYDKNAYSSARSKQVAFLNFKTAAVTTNTTPNSSVIKNCQSYSGEDGTYNACVNNTIYQSNNFVTYVVKDYNSDTLTISYSAVHSGNVNPDTGTLSVSKGQSTLLSLPWAMRAISIGYQGKDTDGRAIITLGTMYDYHSAVGCSSASGGDGDYNLCLGQQLTHSSGAVFKLRSVYTYLAKVEIGNVYETSGGSDPKVWAIDPSQTVNLQAIKTGGVLGAKIQLNVVGVGSDYITLHVQTL